jgi:hypothetical protein
MPTQYQKRQIRLFNRKLLSAASGVALEDVTGDRKLGLPPQPPVLGITPDAFMALRTELNEELTKSTYARSTPVGVTEYKDVYGNAAKGKVRHFHQMTYGHIGLPALPAAAKKAAGPR